MSEELIQRVIKVIAATQKIAPERITIDSTFEELGIDSLDGINILFALENEFNVNIPDEGAQGLKGIRDMVEALDNLLASGQAGAAGPASKVEILSSAGRAAMPKNYTESAAISTPRCDGRIRARAMCDLTCHFLCGQVAGDIQGRRSQS